MKLSKYNVIIKPMNSTLIDLPSPSNISYIWNFGSLLGLCLTIQILTGVFLAMHYCSDTELAFNSMMHMISDVNYGFTMKSIHSNGASVFFMCVYVHMGKALYYGSYMKKTLWFSGVIMYIIMMLTAFMGYVLPWGQMSFWGATVMTNFLSAMPYVGIDIVQWVWGGFAVNNATLASFYSLHYLFPFVLMGLIIIHLILLHSWGSSNPVGTNSNSDKIPFHSYYTSKDLLGFMMMMLSLFYLSLFKPNLLGDPENFIKANSLVTPIHIMPEWYFLFAYAILSSIPNKLGGVLALVFSMLMLFSLPFTNKHKINSTFFKPMSKLFFWIFVMNFFLLTWMGSKPVEEPFTTIGLISNIYYFFYFMMITPTLSIMENKIMFNK